MSKTELKVESIDTLAIRSILKSQYHAALTMLRDALERCPEDLWTDTSYKNSFWQVAYHTLFFTHLYLQPNEAAFVPWEHHQSAVQHEDAIAGLLDPESTLPLIPNPYTRSEVLSYWKVCEEMVDSAVDAMNLHDPSSGFSWYNVSKFEHQLISLRHVQHHTAQLADRLRAAANIGIKWVGPH
jgi:hypothetical protein